MKKLRKALASILSLCMLSSLAITSPVSVQAVNEADTLQVNTQIQNEEINILSVQMQNNVANVEFNTITDAQLVVAIYDTEGVAMLESATTAIKAGDTLAEVTIDIETMPDFYYVKAFIVDKKTFRPLCEVYEKYCSFPRIERCATTSLGERHSAYVSETGVLYMWGYNGDGQLGFGDPTSYNYVVRTPIKIMNNVKKVSLGFDHSAAITENDDLYLWGDNDFGEIGNGKSDYHKVKPVKIMSDVKDVSLGNHISAAVTNAGDLYMWGDNSMNQLADGVITKSVVPVKVMSNVKSVELGAYHCAAITEAGDLYMWGNNAKGQIGDNTDTTVELPKLIMSNVKSVNLGFEHSAAITENGDLYMWGCNGCGRLGDGTMVDRWVPQKLMSDVKSVSLGTYFSAAITENGDLYTWGYNEYGQLGNGTTRLSTKPVKVMCDVKEVALGRGHISAIDNNGVFYIWGQDAGERLGISDIGNQSLPMELTIYNTPDAADKSGYKTKKFNGLFPKKKYNFHIMKTQESNFALDSDNLLYVAQFKTDENGNGSVIYETDEEYKNACFFVLREVAKREIISVDVQGDIAKVDLDTMLDGELVVSVYDVNGIEMIASGTKIVSAFDETVEVKIDTSKMPQYFYLKAFLVDSKTLRPLCAAYESADYARVSQKIEKVSLGYDHSAVISDKGDLYMWGNNQNGQLARDYLDKITTPVKVMSNVKDVELGNGYSAAITENNDLYMWGYNQKGGLGDGTNTKSVTPIKIMSDVRSVCLGTHHSAAITQNGDLYLWGYNSHGQIGNGKSSPEYASEPKPVKVMSNVKSVSLGVLHTAAITENGILYVWGNNYYGQLGIGDEHSYMPTPIKVKIDVREVSLGDYTTAALTNYDFLYMWGDNSHEQMANSTYEYFDTPKRIHDNVKSVTLGSNHCARISYYNKLYTCGCNEYGQLGNGETDDSSVFIRDVLTNVKDASLGGNHSAAITQNGELYMWGDNRNGQLGNGDDDKEFRNTPIKVGVYTSLVNMEETENYTTKEFTGLLPDETYNFYLMKSRDAENLFSVENLLYITQAVTDTNGNLSIDYKFAEDYENEVCFVVPADLSDFVFGDINNDGDVDVKDVTTLQMHLANYDVDVNENALDVNGNSVIDVTDVTTLQMLLAGYEI